MKSFEEFQAAVKLSQNVFQRPALIPLYDLFTAGNDLEGSFIRPSLISSGDTHQTWRTVQIGVKAAIASLRKEFQRKVNANGAGQYMDTLQDGESIIQFLLSVKGVHHPLNSDIVPERLSGPSHSNQVNFSIY